jgi:hypothetical protein
MRKTAARPAMGRAKARRDNPAGTDNILNLTRQYRLTILLYTTMIRLL